MFVTTYTSTDDGAKDLFIRLNATHNGAWDEALNDAKEDMREKYTHVNGTQEIDCIEGEGDDPSIIRIINPHNGYEYEAFIITDRRVGI